MPLDIEVALRVLFPEGPERWARLPGGSRVPSWRVDARGEVFAVKFYAGADSRAAFVAERLSAWLGDARFPVPRATACAFPGGVALVTPWVRGRTIADVLQHEPWHAAALGGAFGEAHARLHALPVPDEARSDVTLLDGGRSVRWLHLDFHPANVLTDAGGVTAVLDWENVRLGDPRWDVARTLSVLSVDPGVRALPANAWAVVRAFRRAYLAEYTRRGERLDAMASFLGWAGETMRLDLAHRYAESDLEHVERWERHVRREASKSAGVPGGHEAYCEEERSGLE